MTVIKGASHSVYQSHAAQVAAVIESAARQVGSRQLTFPVNRLYG